MVNPGNIYVGVVDDDESMRRSWGRLLRLEGFQVVTYPSAEAFLDDRKQPHFDCLLLDIRLGGMPGIELQQRLAASGCKTPVVFITAYDVPEVREEALAAGCAGYFRKSDPSEGLLTVIHEVTGPR